MFYHFFDNELKLFKVSAENDVEAAKQGLIDFCDTEESKKEQITCNDEMGVETLEEIKDECFDADICINVIEL